MTDQVEEQLKNLCLNVNKRKEKYILVDDTYVKCFDGIQITTEDVQKVYGNLIKVYNQEVNNQPLTFEEIKGALIRALDLRRQINLDNSDIDKPLVARFDRDIIQYKIMYSMVVQERRKNRFAAYGRYPNDDEITLLSSL